MRMIGLKQLTLKLHVYKLVALVSAQRAQTISLLSLDNMVARGGKITFVVEELVKQSRPNNVGQVVELEEYPADRRLCAKTVIREYISHTKKLRKNELYFL